MRLILYSLVALAALASTTHAQCRQISYGSSYRHSYNYGHNYAKVYKAPAYDYAYQAVIPVFQIEVRKYSTYGAVYQPPVPTDPAQPAGPNPAVSPTPAAAQVSEIRAVLDKLSGIDNRLKKIEDVVFRRAGPEAAPQPQKEPGKEPPQEPQASGKLPDVHAVAQAKCAACHDAKLGDNAASPVLVKDGKIVPLSDHDAALTLVKLAKNKACPGAAKKGIAPTTPEEYTAFVLYLEKAPRRKEEKGT